MVVSRPTSTHFFAHRISKRGFLCLRVSAALALCSFSIGLAVFALGSPSPHGSEPAGVMASTPNTWSVLDSPNRHDGPRNNALRQVACISDSDCWTVGNYFTGTATQTLTEHWNGTTWSVVPSANIVGTDADALQSVACNSPSDCWAVGQAYTSSTGVSQTLTLHWDGMAWTVIPSQNVAGDNIILNGVACSLTFAALKNAEKNGVISKDSRFAS